MNSNYSWLTSLLLKINYKFSFKLLWISYNKIKMFIWQSIKMSLVGVGFGSFYIYWRLHEQARDQRSQIKKEF